MPNYGDQFQGKVVIVTGGARGIGHAIVTHFADAGASVLCMDLDVEAGNALTGGYTGPGEIVFQRADAAQAADCAAAVDAAVARWGALDIICNNVGIMPSNAYVPANELSEAMRDQIMNVNLKSAI